MEIAEPLLYDFTTRPSMSEPSSVFFILFLVNNDPYSAVQKTHVALPFEVPGGWRQDFDSTVYFADLRVLNHHQEPDSFSTFSSVYNDSGLFGIYLVTDCQLLAIATPGQVTELELHRAKNATKSAVLMNLESRVYHNVTGDVICHGDKSVIKEGHKSFPSGHASWCFAGLAFLALYLSALVGVSRVDDYWHHWQDVFVGGLLGL
ncbi:hypothetical protein H6P81_015929 [Aristolochia fimbriata]|uniref:Phosphatidic acid phosphatase type 2/haloperoxidase domain-containing protein n=1 Tax=Aristolochia fimbriata TaxID=158543 RepID=A0AAV7E755_ARIFI|nr:hypothetical protein H6P81_015929 [Aristolochia fimbriata]